MLKNLKYYYHLLAYKLSLEGEDSDNTYQGQMPYHTGHGKSYFNMSDLEEGYPQITNIKMSPRQQKLKERELAELAKMREKAREERLKLQAEFKEKQKQIQDKKAAAKAERREKSQAKRDAKGKEMPKAKNWGWFRKKVVTET
jgi:nucleosome binding factor SPN SPT16 subunit